MQQLAEETTPPGRSTPGATAAECAAHLLDVAPLVMRRVRAEMRRQAEEDLSVPLFRTLRYLIDHPGASLSDVAEAFSLTMPTASKLVQKLVTQGVVERREGEDRRRIHLSVTEEGRNALALARRETARQLARSLESLSQEDLQTVAAALGTLRRAFSRQPLAEGTRTETNGMHHGHLP